MTEDLCQLPTERLRNLILIRSPLLRNALSELFGTALLLFIGLGVCMQFILSHEKLNTWINVNIGWGFAIAFCVYATSQTSGGHFNPAVSFAMVTLGKLSIHDFIVYVIVQVIGAFIGTIGAYFLYLDQFDKFTGSMRTLVGLKATGGCFTSFPPSHISNCTAFFDQIVGTYLLVFFVCVVTDKRNKLPPASHPLLFGFVVMMIGTCYGMNLGYPINPARDFGPRLFALFLYGTQVFSYHNYYFWIPIIAPMIGGPLGAWSYYLFIGCHISDDDNKPIYLYKDDARKPLKNGDEV